MITLRKYFEKYPMMSILRFVLIVRFGIILILSIVTTEVSTDSETAGLALLKLEAACVCLFWIYGMAGAQVFLG
jgi:hypothetical protein